MNQFEFIKLENIGETCKIVFNRPKQYNAMNKAMKKEIVKAIKNINKDENIKSIILTGEGKSFSSGQDLNDRNVQNTNGSVDLGNVLIAEWLPVVDAIRNSKKIVIAAVNGVCAGAGLSVALNCDLVISTPQNKFISGFAAIGLAPDAGSSFLFARALGTKKSLEFFLLNKPILAEELLEKGMINFINENVIEEALTLASKINSLAPLACFQIKKMLQVANDNDFNEVTKRECYVQRYLGNSQDYAEGVKAFLEKRTPEFKGQ